MIIDKQPFDMVLLVINNIRVFLSSGFFVHQFGYDPILKYKIIVAISSDRNASQIKLENASMLFTNQYQEEMSDFSYRLLSKSQYFDAVNKTIESMKKDNASLKTFICKEIIYFLQNSSEQNALSISSNILSNYRLKYGREKSLEDAVKDIISYYCICVHEMYLSYPREVILRTGLETINLLSDNEYCKESRRIIIEFTKRNDKSATYRYILNMFRTAMEYRSLETCIKLTEFALNEFGNKYGIRSELAHKIFETLMDVLQRELLKHSNNLSINNISEEESLIEGFDIRDMEVLMEKYPRNDIYASVLQNLSLALRQMSFSQCSKIFINVIRECNTKYGRNPEFDLKIIKLLNDSIL